MIDFKLYNISINKVFIENEEFYVGNVEEFQDVKEYAYSYTEAYNLIIETIKMYYELCITENILFPAPINTTKCHEIT